jgi:hypothetical protein
MYVAKHGIENISLKIDHLSTVEEKQSSVLEHKRS